MTDHHHHQSVREYLSSIKAIDIPGTKPDVIIINSSETPFQAFKKLVDNNILSAPVWSEETKQYTGFMDMKDLVSFVIYIDDDQNSSAPNNLEDIVLSGLKLFKAPVDGVTVTYLSRRRPFRSVSTNDSLYHIMELLAKGTHRVAVIDDSGKAVRIVSQSSVIQFLSKNISHLGNVISHSIAELNLGTSPVLTVSHADTAADVFRHMEKKNKSSVAVVDLDGRLIGNTSSSDIKMFIKTPSLDILKQPITQFLKFIRNFTEIDIHTPVIAVPPEEKLAMLIHRLASTKVHKIFVAQESTGFKADKIVSIIDVVREIIKQE